MDFWQTVQVVFRRWYITFPAFLGALGVAALVYGSVPTQYVSTSVLLLTTPKTGPTEQIDSKHPNEITNPLLNFEQGLSLSASMLIQTLSTPEAVASLGISPGGDTSYEVNNGSTNPELLESGPFVFIEGTSTSARRTPRTLFEESRRSHPKTLQAAKRTRRADVNLHHRDRGRATDHSRASQRQEASRRWCRRSARGAGRAWQRLSPLRASRATRSFAVQAAKISWNPGWMPKTRTRAREQSEAMMSVSSRLPSLVCAAVEDSLMPRRSADGATLVVLFVVFQLVLSARLVISKLPLSLSPASILALGIGLCWLCAQFTNTLGVAKGRNPVRTMLFVYLCSVLASYGLATYGYLPADELNLADHALVLALASVGMALGVCDGVRGRDRLDLVLKTVAAMGAVVAIVGILQYLFNVDLTQYMMKLPGLRSTSQDGFVFERSAMRRVAATTSHPIEFGVVCAMLLPLAVHLATKARGRSSALAALVALFRADRDRSDVLDIPVRYPRRRWCWSGALPRLACAATRASRAGSAGIPRTDEDHRARSAGCVLQLVRQHRKRRQRPISHTRLCDRLDGDLQASVVGPRARHLVRPQTSGVRQSIPAVPGRGRRTGSGRVLGNLPGWHLCRASGPVH